MKRSGCDPPFITCDRSSASRRPSASPQTQIRAYINVRQEQAAANATIQNEPAALRRSFNLAHQAGRILTVPHVPSVFMRGGFFEEEKEPERLLGELPLSLRPAVRFAAWFHDLRRTAVRNLEQTGIPEDGLGAHRQVETDGRNLVENGGH